MDVTDLESAIRAYEASAAQLYAAAQNALLNPPAAPPPPDPAPPPETRDQFIKRNQGQLSAAFSQFSSVETMRSAQAGRDGYAAIVTLMVAASATAGAICDQLTTYTQILKTPTGSGTTPESLFLAKLPTIEALTGMLKVLAQIAPVAVWENSPSSGPTS